jgi:hypothetical protein
MFWHSSRERHGRRIWWHFGGDRRRSIAVELGWWHHFCHLGLECDDEGWSASWALPPLFLHVSLKGFPLWRPRVPHAFAGGPPVWLVDRREARLAIHDWAIWLTVWGRWGEWRRADPWWVRGVTLHLDDLVLGRTQYVCETLGPPVSVLIPMPEGNYPATLTPQRQTWTRPRGWTIVRTSFDIEIPKGIPFAGKGENSWDCGDDGLYGMGAGGTVEEAIAAVQASVTESRRRYGRPSPRAIQEALG